MKARLIAFVFGVGLAAASLAQHEPELDAANNNIANTASLQRGAKYFVNYCMGCHSAQYVRYNRLAQDLQLTEDQLVENLMFTGERPFDTMAIAMRPEDSTRWFGTAPPDLSLIARSRGTDYVFTFLRSFHEDASKPTGVDNAVLSGTAMPHVLWELQRDLSPTEFDQVVRDIVNFLDYIGEPMQRERQALGIRVIAFLLVFLLIAYLLKKEIWKDVK